MNKTIIKKEEKIFSFAENDSINFFLCHIVLFIKKKSSHYKTFLVTHVPTVTSFTTVTTVK